MEFKAFILLFAFVVVTASGSSICKCAEEEPKDSVSKYKLKVKEGNTEVDETIEIDTDKETETIHVADNGDKSETAPGEVDVVHDFKLNLVMHRLSNQKSCFLSNSTKNLPKPAALKILLDTDSSQQTSQEETVATKENYMIAGSVNDRSFLSDEMAALCAKLPIYRVKAIAIDLDQDTSVTRIKRQKTCRLRRSCYRVCFLIICYTRCYWAEECTY